MYLYINTDKLWFRLLLTYYSSFIMFRNVVGEKVDGAVRSPSFSSLALSSDVTSDRVATPKNFHEEEKCLQAALLCITSMADCKIWKRKICLK
jgi:hypothetical protein